MLNMLLQDIGQRLSRKPFEWMSWWWGVRWGDFITICPPLTEQTPLWQREDSSLKSIRLFGLPPDELQAEIARYWAKPFWRRWLSRLFTSIESRFTVWSYYQRCLSFRTVQQQNPVTEQQIMLYEPEQKLVRVLVDELSRDGLALEKRLEKHSGNLKWIQKNFSLLLTEHEKKKHHSFLKLMEKHLKKLPTECDQDLVRRKLEKEYQRLEKMLRTYLQTWYQSTFNQHEATEASALVYVGPTVAAARTVNPSFESDLSCSMSSINLWVSHRRQTIDAILQEGHSEEEQMNRVKTVLEESLNNLMKLVGPQIESYQQGIREAIQGRVHYQEVIKCSESLQSGLLKVYRSSALLFHPDKINGSVGLRILLTELFQQFKRSSEASLEKIQQGQESLKEWFGCSPEWELRIRKLLQEMAEDRVRHSAYMREKLNELEESIKGIREQLHALDVKFNNNEEELNVVKEGCKINKERFNLAQEEFRLIREEVKTHGEQLNLAQEESRVIREEVKAHGEQLDLMKEQLKGINKEVGTQGKEIKELTKLAKQFLPASENQAQVNGENEKASTSSSPRP